jgi:hypothetical protein
MNTTVKQFAAFSLLLLLISCSAPGNNENTIVSIKTSLGDIKIKLYDGTPMHRDNFIKLVNTGFYDGISFHRVIKDFMIQAGDPATRTGLTKEQLDTLDNYTIAAEFRKDNIIRKECGHRLMGNGNPAMRSGYAVLYRSGIGILITIWSPQKADQQQYQMGPRDKKADSAAGRHCSSGQ